MLRGGRDGEHTAQLVAELAMLHDHRVRVDRACIIYIQHTRRARKAKTDQARQQTQYRASFLPHEWVKSQKENPGWKFLRARYDKTKARVTKRKTTIK
jgi:hypothetical protein